MKPSAISTTSTPSHIGLPTPSTPLLHDMASPLLDSYSSPTPPYPLLLPYMNHPHTDANLNTNSSPNPNKNTSMNNYPNPTSSLQYSPHYYVHPSPYSPDLDISTLPQPSLPSTSTSTSISSSSSSSSYPYFSTSWDPTEPMFLPYNYTNPNLNTISNHMHPHSNITTHHSLRHHSNSSNDIVHSSFTLPPLSTSNSTPDPPSNDIHRYSSHHRHILDTNFMDNNLSIIQFKQDDTCSSHSPLKLSLPTTSQLSLLSTCPSTIISSPPSPHPSLSYNDHAVLPNDNFPVVKNHPIIVKQRHSRHAYTTTPNASPSTSHPSSIKKRQYPCLFPGCSKVFTSSGHLHRHERSIHGREKPYSCPFPQCGARFTRNDNRWQHYRTHFCARRQYKNSNLPNIPPIPSATEIANLPRRGRQLSGRVNLNNNANNHDNHVDYTSCTRESHLISSNPVNQGSNNNLDQPFLDNHSNSIVNSSTTASDYNNVVKTVTTTTSTLSASTSDCNATLNSRMHSTS